MEIDPPPGIMSSLGVDRGGEEVLGRFNSDSRKGDYGRECYLFCCDEVDKPWVYLGLEKMTLRGYLVPGLVSGKWDSEFITYHWEGRLECGGRVIYCLGVSVL